ncbi:MAG: hypothetical protein NC344_04245 [Bacteroidales bacterium]|nr:hypothetical protein [Bacteroidales bacterium]MCM1147038.1 hypothetical protein [Bacteroidales bacterium]MCM1205829.1 hypothetical protein [Bacillota bacterium]MCM1509928.1 hypothetical protein [Clostridium sp.]
MSKKVFAVRPYQWPGRFNFKIPAYDGWVKAGGLTAPSHYPYKIFHGLVFRADIKKRFFFHNEARLRFVQPVSIKFDSFPDHILYEIIPFVWDCWPQYFDMLAEFFERHKVRTSIFTSSQVATLFQKRFPDMNVLFCPEGIDSSVYKFGGELNERSLDLLEYGRVSKNIFEINVPKSIRHSYRKNGVLQFSTNEELFNALADAKITISLPQSMTNPEVAEGIETLTQRYWECMLSGTILLGHAPKELVNLVGYNPVIELDESNANEQILDILAHIEDYQPLVNKNREFALEFGNWAFRMKMVMEWLESIGYKTKL